LYPQPPRLSEEQRAKSAKELPERFGFVPAHRANELAMR
jgi:hypothetical protein